MTDGGQPSLKRRWRLMLLALELIGATLLFVYAEREKPEHLTDFVLCWVVVRQAWPVRYSEEPSRLELAVSFIGIGLSLLMTLTGFLMSDGLWTSELVFLGISACLICFGQVIDAQRPAHVALPASRMLLSLAAIAAAAIFLLLALHPEA